MNGELKIKIAVREVISIENTLPQILAIKKIDELKIKQKNDAKLFPFKLNIITNKIMLPASNRFVDQITKITGQNISIRTEKAGPRIPTSGEFGPLFGNPRTHRKIGNSKKSSTKKNINPNKYPTVIELKKNNLALLSSLPDW